MYFGKNLLALRMEAKYSSRSSGLKMFMSYYSQSHIKNPNSILVE